MRIESPCEWRVLRTASTPCWNLSVFATKSVSQVISTMVTSRASLSNFIPMKPSDVYLPVRLAASARPRLRRRSFAFSRSPWVSSNTFMQSFKGDPVIALSSFTSFAELVCDVNVLASFLMKRLAMSLYRYILFI